MQEIWSSVPVVLVGIRIISNGVEKCETWEWIRIRVRYNRSPQSCTYPSREYEVSIDAKMGVVKGRNADSGL